MRGLHRLLIGMAVALSPCSAAAADSDLLNGVKRNPEEARAMCQDFRALNDRGQSAYAKATTRDVAKARRISLPDAEVLITYVVGIHCPDVR